MTKKLFEMNSLPFRFWHSLDFGGLVFRHSLYIQETRTSIGFRHPKTHRFQLFGFHWSECVWNPNFWFWFQTLVNVLNLDPCLNFRYLMCMKNEVLNTVNVRNPNIRILAFLKVVRLSNRSDFERRLKSERYTSSVIGRSVHLRYIVRLSAFRLFSLS